MYCAFYGFRERPFNLTPDPRFLYLNATYREAAASLAYGINERKGFICLIGEAGTGKTTLLRHLLDGFDRRTRTVLVFNPRVSFGEMLEYALTELGVTLTSTRKLHMLQRLNGFLLRELQAGGNVALLIDEAQDLAPSVLEDLRLLSNLETAREKILQIVLAGQPELEPKLADPRLRQLRQRIAVRCHLRPLTEDEIANYVATRIAVAGRSKGGPFTPEAISAIARCSQGIPRLVNVVADNALLIGFAGGHARIDASVVAEAWTDLRGQEPEVRRPTRRGAAPAERTSGRARAAGSTRVAQTAASGALPPVDLVAAGIPEASAGTNAPAIRAAPPAAGLGRTVARYAAAGRAAIEHVLRTLPPPTLERLTGLRRHLPGALAGAVVTLVLAVFLGSALTTVPPPPADERVVRADPAPAPAVPPIPSGLVGARGSGGAAVRDTSALARRNAAGVLPPPPVSTRPTADLLGDTPTRLVDEPAETDEDDDPLLDPEDGLAADGLDDPWDEEEEAEERAVAAVVSEPSPVAETVALGPPQAPPPPLPAAPPPPLEAAPLGVGEVSAVLEAFRQRYNARDAEGLAALFAPDGSENARHGPAAIRAAYRDTFETLREVRYSLADVTFDFDGPRAGARSSFLVTYVDDDGQTGAVEGRARWRIERRQDGTKITAFDYTTGESTDDDLATADR
jgi:general secretion pathway protein A